MIASSVFLGPISVGPPGFDRLRGHDASLHALDDILRYIAVGRAPCLVAARSVSGRRIAYRNRPLLSAPRRTRNPRYLIMIRGSGLRPGFLKPRPRLTGGWG